MKNKLFTTLVSASLLGLASTLIFQVLERNQIAIPSLKQNIININANDTKDFDNEEIHIIT